MGCAGGGEEGEHIYIYIYVCVCVCVFMYNSYVYMFHLDDLGYSLCDKCLT